MADKVETCKGALGATGGRAGTGASSHVNLEIVFKHRPFSTRQSGSLTSAESLPLAKLTRQGLSDGLVRAGYLIRTVSDVPRDCDRDDRKQCGS